MLLNTSQLMNDMINANNNNNNDNDSPNSSSDHVSQLTTSSGEVTISLAIFSPGELDPLVSAQTRHVSKLVFECGVQQLIMWVGIPGNVLCCVAFVMNGLKDRINLLLFSLAVADLLNLLSMFVPRLSCLLRWGWSGDSDPDGAADRWDNLTTVFLAHLSRWSGFVSGFLVLVISVDRCLSVTLPLKAAGILTYRPMLATIVVTYVIPLACFIPNYLVYRVSWQVDPSTNRTTSHVTLVDDIIPRSVPSQIVRVLTVLIKPISIVIVIVCCLLTVVTLHRASRKRARMQEMQSRRQGEAAGESRITSMLLFLCAVYLVLILPEVCAALVNYFLPEFIVLGKYHNTFLVVYQVIFTASALNSSANFFAYLLLSSKFQSTLKSVCACGGFQRRRHVEEMTKVTTEF